MVNNISGTEHGRPSGVNNSPECVDRFETPGPEEKTVRQPGQGAYERAAIIPATLKTTNPAGYDNLEIDGTYAL
ncbi:MAG: hypothetical protein WBB39_02920 [Candidatus Saccharimonadales bacterium]